MFKKFSYIPILILSLLLTTYYKELPDIQYNFPLNIYM